jgi:RNA polymerase sigma-70 factor (ECF subfamily)
MLHELVEKMEVKPDDREQTMVRACLQGDEAAWEAMVQAQTKRIFNLCLRFAGRRDEAEDLTQEIFVRIYRSLGSFRSESGNFQCWVLSVARNLIIDHYRRERRYKTPIGSDEMEAMHLEDDRTPNPSRAFERAEASRLLSRALRGLSPDLREAVILRDLEGMSYQQVAKTTGVSEGTVKSRLFRARLRLIKIFTGRAALAHGIGRQFLLTDFQGHGSLSGLPEAAACALE